jgi:hypothetical protein
MCKHAAVSRSQVNNRVLQFNNIIRDILNKKINIILPAKFKKIKNHLNIVAQPDSGANGSSGGSSSNGYNRL